MSLISDIEDICGITPEMRARRAAATGRMVAVHQKDIPKGWVQVTYFLYKDSEPTDYLGPLLAEMNNLIQIEVYGEPITFPLSRVIVTRALGE